MIIGQDVLRLITVNALKGRTAAGDRVYDSPAQPADLMIEQDRAPFVAVYTDDADFDLSDSQSLHNANNDVFLLIECATAVGMGVEEDVMLAPTDKALELSIGLLAREVTQALLATNSRWAELWREFTATGRVKVEVRRGGPGQDGQESAIRYASRIMRMQVRLLADPVAGEGVPKGFWTHFIEAAEGDVEAGGLAEIAPILRAHFEAPPGVPSWRIEQKRGTYTLKALKTLGIAPLDPVIADEAEAPQLKKADPEQVVV